VVSGNEDLDLQAFVVFANVGYTVDSLWGKPRFGLGYDYASGDSDPNDGKQETFEPLFGTNHNYYGVMDLIGPRNINSPRVSFGLKPTKKLSLTLDYILFWLADDHDSFYPESGSPRNANGYGKNPKYDSYVGSELDIVAKYAVASWGELSMGYGHFFTGDYIESSVGSVSANGGSTDADWVYMQATFTF
jgi:hypothetical protein